MTGQDRHGGGAVAALDLRTAAAERGQPKATAHQLAASVRELEALSADELSERTRASLIKAARRLGGR